MALLGPMVVVAESSAADLIDVLGKAGAFPIVETRWADAPTAIAEMQPVALAREWEAGSPETRRAIEVPDVNHYTIALGTRGARAVGEAIAAAARS